MFSDWLKKPTSRDFFVALAFLDSKLGLFFRALLRAFVACLIGPEFARAKWPRKARLPGLLPLLSTSIDTSLYSVLVLYILSYVFMYAIFAMFVIADF